MNATEVMKTLRVEIVSNGVIGDVVASEGRRAYNIRIGKAPTNHVVLAHSSVSREHAVAFVRDGVVYLADLGSRNGTRVSGCLLDPYLPQRLPSAAVVQFGDVRAKIHYE